MYCFCLFNTCYWWLWVLVGGWIPNRLCWRRRCHWSSVHPRRFWCRPVSQEHRTGCLLVTTMFSGCITDYRFLLDILFIFLNFVLFTTQFPVYLKCPCVLNFYYGLAQVPWTKILYFYGLALNDVKFRMLYIRMSIFCTTAVWILRPSRMSDTRRIFPDE